MQSEAAGPEDWPRAGTCRKVSAGGGGEGPSRPSSQKGRGSRLRRGFRVCSSTTCVKGRLCSRLLSVSYPMPCTPPLAPLPLTRYTKAVSTLPCFQTVFEILQLLDVTRFRLNLG